MGKLVDEFRQVRKDPFLSAADAIRILCDRCPNDISFSTTRNLLDGDAAFNSSKVVIGKKSSFVASNACQEICEENAAKFAVDFLMEQIKSKDLNTGFDHRDKLTMEKIMDRELLQIIAHLKDFGYSVETLDFPKVNSNNLANDFHVTFVIPGIGEFSGQSSDQKIAYEIAAEKLKTSYYEDFEFKPRPKPTFSLAPNVLELIGFEGEPPTPPSSLESPQPFERFCYQEAKLTICDQSWIDLVNHFNGINLPTRKYSDIITDLITADFMKYTVDTDKFNSKRKMQNCYQTTLLFANYSLTSKDLSESLSRDRTYLKAYSLLRKLSKLLHTIKTDYSTDKSSLEIMETFLQTSDFNSIINVQTKTRKNSASSYANIRLTNMFIHEATAFTESEALDTVYGCILGYLKTISEYILEKPAKIATSIVSTPSSFLQSPRTLSSTTQSVYSDSQGSGSGYRTVSSFNRTEDQIGPLSDETLFKAIQTLQDDRQWYLPPTTNISPEIERLAPLAQLIDQFKQVYDVELYPMEIIELLIDKSPGLFNSTIEFDDKHEVYVFQLKSLELGNFVGASVSKHEARIQAFVQVFEMLHKFAILSSSFKLVRSPYTSPQQFMDVFTVLNAELISKKTWPVSSHKYRTCIKVESLHVRFQDEGNNVEESQWRAFEWLVKFLDQFCRRINHTININKPAHQEVTSFMGRNAYRRPFRKISTAFDIRRQRFATYQGSIKTMELILRFHQVNSVDVNRPHVEVITDLMNIDSNIFNRKTISEHDRKGNKRYQTVLKVAHLGSFTTMEETRDISKNEAFLMVYNRLFKLGRLLDKIQQITIDSVKIAKIDKWCQNKPDLMKGIVYSDGHGHKTVTLTVTNISSFTATSRDVNSAKVVCFNKLAHALFDLKQEAMKSLNIADNNALEKLKLDIALTKAANNQGVDASLAARIKLLKDFLSVYAPTKSAGAIVKEMIAKNEAISFIQSRCTFFSESFEYTATISVTDVGEFYGCAKSPGKAMEDCAVEVYRYLAQLNNLLTDFKKFYSSTKPATRVIEELIGTGHFQLISISKLNNNHLTDPNLHYLRVVQLNRMRSFGRVASSIEDAFYDASTHAVEYIKKLAQGVHGQF